MAAGSLLGAGLTFGIFFVSPQEGGGAQGGAAGGPQPGTEGLAAPRADQSVLPVGDSPFTMPERLLHPWLAPARSR